MPLFCWNHLYVLVENDLIKQHGKAKLRGTDLARKAGTGKLEASLQITRKWKDKMYRQFLQVG